VETDGSLVAGAIVGLPVSISVDGAMVVGSVVVEFRGALVVSLSVPFAGVNACLVNGKNISLPHHTLRLYCRLVQSAA